MLLDLPGETLCHIAESILPQRDRYALVRSCRRLYTVLLPTLYSRVVLCDVRNHTIGQVSQFFNAIARQPHLASAVRVLRLECWDTKDSIEDINCDFEYDGELIKKVVADTCWSAQPYDELQRGNTDAWLALLLPQLKGLIQISICYPFGSDYVDEMFVKAAKEDITAFRRLASAFAEWHDTENGIESSCMEPFFKFPAMRRIGGSKMVDCSLEDGEPRITPFSGVTHIDLDMTNTELGFDVWIKSCKALKTFRLEIGGSIISDGPAIVVAPLRESISLHKSTLEAFWLSGNSSEDLEEDQDEDDGWMGSFADFNMMTYLHIPISMLAGLDENFEPTHDLVGLLPPSVETLFLCLCPEELLDWAVDQLQSLVGSNCLPRLTSLGLEGWGPSEIDESSVETLRKLDELEKRCSEVGLYFATSIGSHRAVPSRFVSLWPCDSLHGW